jgi:hypothetical protein
MTSEEPLGNLLDMSYEEFAKVYANIQYHSKLSPDVFDLVPYLFIMVLWSR